MIYQRPGSPYWYAAFYIKAPDGRLVKKAFSTKTQDKTKALDIERQLKAKVEELREKKRYESFFLRAIETMTEQTAARPGFPLAMVWDRVENDPSQGKRTARTLQSKRNAWANFYSWVQESYPDVTALNDVSREIALEYMRTFKDKSSSTFNNNKNSLSSIWQVLMIPANLRENIWRLVKGAEDDSVSYRDFSLVEVRAILSNAAGFWKYATAIAFYTGLRLKDIVHLRKTQIHGEYIILVPAKTRRTGKDVYIFIHPDLKKILDSAIAELPESQDYLFQEAVRNYKKKAFQLSYGKVLEKCKIKPDSRGIVGFHSLRHTFVTINEAAGVDRKVLQGIVGHGFPVMTGHYSHDRESVKILQKMPSLLAE